MPNSTSPGSNETADDNEVNPFDADVERHKRAAASPTLPAEKRELAASDIERLEQLQQRGPELERRIAERLQSPGCPAGRRPCRLGAVVGTLA